MLASNKILTEESVTYLILKGDVTKPLTSTYRDRLRNQFNTGTNIQVWGRKDCLSCLIYSVCFLVFELPMLSHQSNNVSRGYVNSVV